MRVLSVNAAVTGGGAESVARSLHREYLGRGIDSWLAVGNLNAPVPNTVAIRNERHRNPWARAVRRLAAAAAGPSASPGTVRGYADRALRMLAEPMRYGRVLRGHEDFDQPGTAHLLELTPGPPDVLHFHNLHGSYFDIRELPRLSREAPSVLTLHDTWLLTGHCAQPFECDRWREGCAECPHLDRYVPLYADASAANLALKRDVLSRSRLGFAAPSRWLLDMAQDSGALHAALDARVIPNGVDTTVFAPGDRTAARDALGLSPDAWVIASAGRDLTSNPYKGFDVLEAALGRLSAGPRDIVVLAIGSDGPGRTEGRVEYRSVPFIDDPARLAEQYRASDLYVHPARAEALGLTIIEALACGVPVVASNVGGIPEVVRSGVNGVLFPTGDADALAEQLRTLLGDPDLRERMGGQAARDAAVRFSLQAQAGAYLSYYDDLKRESGR